MSQLRGDSSPAGGFWEAADRLGWDVQPTLLAVAPPGATLTDDCLIQFWDGFVETSAEAFERGVDAIYLILHGAAATQTHADVEGEMLQRIRKIPAAAAVPIFGVYDLHANFSPAMAEHADGLIAYRENPHTDAKATAIDTAEFLQRCLASGRRPRQYYRRFPVLWPPIGTATAAPPMRTLLDRAAELQKKFAGIVAININAGFSYSDGPHVSASASVVTDGSPGEAGEILDELHDLAVKIAPIGDAADEPIDQVFENLGRWRSTGKLDGLTVLVEPSDNIGGGAPGDGVVLLRRLIEDQYDNAAFCLWDPVAVQTSANHRIGDRVRLSLGGQGDDRFGGPLTVECQLLQLGSGEFELEDKQSHLAAMCGDRYDMGPCAVVACEGVTILLTSVATPTWDLGQWRHFGFNPEDFSIIIVKAAVAHRRAFDPIARRQIWVDTPGPCSSNLANFHYKNLTRPIHPLDR